MAIAEHHLSRTNLTIPSDRFVGRADELSRVASALQSGRRLITLWGPGGIGKTRLALQSGERAIPDHDGGVWFCDLSESRSAPDLCGVVARVLGIPLTRSTSDDDAALQIGRSLAARGKTLLILDNFEQLIAAGPATVGRWMSMAPRAAFMTTSRELLHLPAEHPVELLPLIPESDGVLLLMERAANHQSLLTSSLAKEVVRRLDGIPLAIELAAARLRLLSPAALLQRLERPLEVLTHKAHVSPRHATLRGALDWSWDLLSAVERDALTQCAVFRGSFPTPLAESVLQLESTPVLDVLQALREKSLLRDAGDMRLRMLETLREYALQKSPPGADLLRRYALQSVVLGEHLGRDLAALRMEEQHLRAALTQDVELAARAVLVLDPLMAADAPPRLHLVMLDDVISRGGLEGALRARVLAARGAARKERTRWDDARTDLEEAIGLARRLGLASVVASATMHLGTVHQGQGRPDDARGLLEDAAAQMKALGDDGQLGICLSHLVSTHHSRGDMERALSQCAESLQCSRRAQDRVSEGRTLSRLGFMQQELGRLEAARATYEQARKVQQSTGNRFLEGVLLGYLGNLSRLERRDDEARTFYDRALTVLREQGERRYESVFLMDLGALHLDQRRPLEARQALEQARTGHLEIGERWGELLLSGYLATAQAMLQDVDGAQRTLARAADLLKDNPNVVVELKLRAGAAHVALARARMTPSEAHRLIQTARHTFSEVTHQLARQASASDHLRLAARILGDALLFTAPPEDALLITPDGTAFRPPHGDWVDLSARQAPARLLACLADSPTVTTADVLVAAGWPGEKIQPKAALNRLRVAINTLRKLGLKDVLQSVDAGYALDSRVVLVRVAHNSNAHRSA